MSDNRYPPPAEMVRNAFAYVFAGWGKFCDASGPLAAPTEPVARYGPIVMNTQAESRQVFDEIERATFLEPQGRG